MSVSAFRMPAGSDFSHSEHIDIHQPDTRQQRNGALSSSLLKSLFSAGRVSSQQDTSQQGHLVQDADLASMGVAQRSGSKFDRVFGNAAFEDDAPAAPAEPGNVRRNNLFESASSRARQQQQQPDQRAVQAEERSEQMPASVDVSSRGPSILAGLFRKTISPNSTIRTDEPLGTLVQAFRGSERDEVEQQQHESSELPSPPLERVLISWEVEIKQMMASGMRDEAIHRAAPSHGLVRCYVKRVKHALGMHSTYEMYLECGDVFLLAARKRKKTKMSTYVISQDLEDLKRDTDNCVAKLKANFVGTEYMLWGKGGERDVRKGYASEDVCLSFQNTVGRKGGPRIMHVIMPLPDSGWQPSAVDGADCLSNALGMSKSKTLPPYLERKMMTLCTKPAEYSEASKGYTLDFQGRVKEASVKNFQLVAWDHNMDRTGGDVLLQFGKIDGNTFALDFAYPMSIESAFAVALASIDTKLCCTL